MLGLHTPRAYRHTDYGQHEQAKHAPSPLALVEGNTVPEGAFPRPHCARSRRASQTILAPNDPCVTALLTSSLTSTRTLSDLFVQVNLIERLDRTMRAPNSLRLRGRAQFQTLA